LCAPAHGPRSASLANLDLPPGALAGAATRVELPEGVALVERPRRQVERCLRVSGEHEERLARIEVGHPPAGEHERQRTRQAARVERRHNPIMSTASPRLAVVLATGELERFYSGLSVLVSTAAEGAPCAALAVFRALALLLDGDLLRRALDPEATPSLSWSGRETFARSLHELRETAIELPAVSLYACSASVDAMGVTPGEVEERLDGVLSTPRFLRDAPDGRLIYV
jgi:peroxiredoxin family protein